MHFDTGKRSDIPSDEAKEETILYASNQLTQEQSRINAELIFLKYTFIKPVLSGVVNWMQHLNSKLTKDHEDSLNPLWLEENGNREKLAHYPTLIKAAADIIPLLEFSYFNNLKAGKKALTEAINKFNQLLTSSLTPPEIKKDCTALPDYFNEFSFILDCLEAKQFLTSIPPVGEQSINVVYNNLPLRKMLAGYKLFPHAFVHCIFREGVPPAATSIPSHLHVIWEGRPLSQQDLKNIRSVYDRFPKFPANSKARPKAFIWSSNDRVLRKGWGTFFHKTPAQQDEKTLNDSGHHYEWDLVESEWLKLRDVNTDLKILIIKYFTAPIANLILHILEAEKCGAKNEALRADLMRILILYFYGGWYADTDRRAAPMRYKLNNFKRLLAADQHDEFTAIFYYLIFQDQRYIPLLKRFKDKYYSEETQQQNWERIENYLAEINAHGMCSYRNYLTLWDKKMTFNHGRANNDFMAMAAGEPFLLTSLISFLQNYLHFRAPVFGVYAQVCDQLKKSVMEERMTGQLDYIRTLTWHDVRRGNYSTSNEGHVVLMKEGEVDNVISFMPASFCLILDSDEVQKCMDASDPQHIKIIREKVEELKFCKLYYKDNQQKITEISFQDVPGLIPELVELGRILCGLVYAWGVRLDELEFSKARQYITIKILLEGYRENFLPAAVKKTRSILNNAELNALQEKIEVIPHKLSLTTMIGVGAITDVSLREKFSPGVDGDLVVEGISTSNGMRWLREQTRSYDDSDLPRRRTLCPR